MRVFYWTEPYGDEPRRLYQIDSDSNFAAQVPAAHIGPELFVGMLEAGFTEISPATAYKMGQPN